jgi:TRAP-type C4-dicarboxylate transport system substrate-binding protein
VLRSMICVLGAAFATSVAAQTYTMKLAVPTVGDPNHEFIKRYKEAIEKNTGGRIKAELYPGGQLGQNQQIMEGVQLGTIEMFSVPPNFARGADARFTVTDAAGIFTDIAHGHRSLTDPAFREQFLSLGVPKGVKGVSIWMYGGTAYASTKPLRSVADFKGKKIRILASRLEIALMSELGASGLPIEYSQVLTALQQGGVDIIRANLVAMGTAKFYTVAKHVLLVDEGFIPEVAFVSTKFLDQLPADLRKQVESTGRQLEEGMLKFSLDFDASEAKRWQANGSEVSKLPPAEQAEFMRRAKRATEHFIAGQPELQPMYKLLTESAARNAKK